MSNSPICELEGPGIFVLLHSDPAAANHLNRLEQNAFTRDYIKKEQVGVVCTEVNLPLLFIDEEGYLLGKYDFSVVEVDRLITEVELYKKILEDGASLDQ